LDPRSSVIPDAIDLKFGTRDYIMLPPNMQKLRTIGPAGAPDKGVKYHVQMFFYFLFVISCAA